MIVTSTSLLFNVITKKTAQTRARLEFGVFIRLKKIKALHHQSVFLPGIIRTFFRLMELNFNVSFLTLLISPRPIQQHNLLCLLLHGLDMCFNDTFSKPSLSLSLSLSFLWGGGGDLTCALDFFFYFKCKQAVLICVELVLQNALSEVHRMMQDAIAA